MHITFAHTYIQLEKHYILICTQVYFHSCAIAWGPTPCLVEGLPALWGFGPLLGMRAGGGGGNLARLRGLCRGTLQPRWEEPEWPHCSPLDAACLLSHSRRHKLFHQTFVSFSSFFQIFHSAKFEVPGSSVEVPPWLLWFTITAALRWLSHFQWAPGHVPSVVQNQRAHRAIPSKTHQGPWGDCEFRRLRSWCWPETCLQENIFLQSEWHLLLFRSSFWSSYGGWEPLSQDCWAVCLVPFGDP